MYAQFQGKNDICFIHMNIRGIFLCFKTLTHKNYIKYKLFTESLDI